MSHLTNSIANQSKYEKLLNDLKQKEFVQYHEIIVLQEQENNALKSLLDSKQTEINQLEIVIEEKNQTIEQLIKKDEKNSIQIKTLMENQIILEELRQSLTERDRQIEEYLTTIKRLDEENLRMSNHFEEKINNSLKVEVESIYKANVLEKDLNDCKATTFIQNEEIKLLRKINDDFSSKLKLGNSIKNDEIDSLKRSNYVLISELDTLKIRLQSELDEKEELMKNLNVANHHEAILHERLSEAIKKAEDSQNILMKVVNDIEDNYGNNYLKLKELTSKYINLKEYVSVVKPDSNFKNKFRSINNSNIMRIDSSNSFLQRSIVDGFPESESNADSTINPKSLLLSHYLNTILSVFTTTAISESEYFNETQVKLNTLSFDKSRIDDMDTQMIVDTLHQLNLHHIENIYLQKNMITNRGLEFLLAWLLSIPDDVIPRYRPLLIDCRDNKVSHSAILQFVSTFRNLSNKEVISLIGFQNDDLIVLVYSSNELIKKSLISKINEDSNNENLQIRNSINEVNSNGHSVVMKIDFRNNVDDL